MLRDISYKEFRKAAYRHYEICDNMFHKFLKSNDFSADKKAQVILEIYYLSGYIIECALKFVLFSHLGFKQNQNVYEYKEKDWKNHDFHKLTTILNELNVKFSQDIPILGSKNGISKNIISLYYNWSTDYRYISKIENIELQEDILETYLQNIKRIKSTLFNQYR